MKRMVFIAIAMLLLASCSSKINYDNLSGTETLTGLDKKVYSDFNKPVNEIVDDLEEPEQIDTTTITNKHTDFKDNLYTLHYDDFDVEIYHAIEIDKFLLQSVLFKSDKYLKEFNISYNMTIEDCDFLLQHKVEEADKNDHTEIVYSLEEDPGVISIVTFYFRNSSLYQVKYNAPID